MGSHGDSLGARRMTIRVVTDSTADLDTEFMRTHGVTMVPLTVEWEGETHQDRVDLDPVEFLQRLPAMKEVPHTAAPSPGSFRAAYEEALASGAEGVLSIHLAGGLSGTVRSAEAAARLVDGPVHVIDTGSASLGIGLLVWWAAIRARQGLSLESLAQEIEQLKGRLFALTAPVTLEYLARGGRIGQAARLVGTILDMKPILLLEKGSFRPERKVRGERQIVPALLSSLKERVPEGTPMLAALGHSGDPGQHDALIQEVRQRWQVLGWLDGVIGPVISSHVGPGAYGIIALPLTADEVQRWKEGLS